MAKRGRPPRHKVREANGRGSRAAEAKRMKAFARWQRRHLVGMLAGKAELTDPLAGSPLGVLYLAGMIGETEHEAGEDYRRSVLDYRRTMGLAFGLPSAIVASGGRGTDPDPDPEIVTAVRRRYARLRAVLNRAGKAVLATVDEICFGGRAGGDLALLRRGLTALARARSARQRGGGVRQRASARAPSAMP